MKKILYMVFALVLCGSLQAQVDRSVQPKPGPAPKINLGKPQSFKLPNGLTVLVVENHKLPRVSFSLSLDNPPSVEGAIKGVDDLASSLLGNGTSKMSKEDFNKKIEFYGANVYFSINRVGGSTLSRYFKEVLTLAAQGALDPSFKQGELDDERAKLLDAIKSDEKNTKAIAGRVTDALVYGKAHPKGEFLQEATINKVTLADVKKYYQSYFVPANAYLVIVGDVNFAEVKSLVTASFSSWKKGVAPRSVYKEPVNLTKTEIDLVDVPHAVQTEVSLNNVVNLKMTSPDYFAALLANQILGGGGEGRLFLNLREAHGWTYGAYSSVSADKYTSDFSASSSVRSNVTDSAIVEMMSEIKRIRTTLPTQEDLDLAKAKYIGSFVMNAEKPETVASFALREKTQMLPATFYTNYIQNINAVTLAQVQAAAQKYILDAGTRIVVAGKASDLLPKLETLNIPIKYFDKEANATEKPEVKVVDASVTPQTVIAKYMDKIGGKAALEGVRTMETISTASMQGQQLTFTAKQTAEGKTAMEISMMGMVVMKTAFDGTVGYMSAQGQKKELQGEELESLKDAIFPELEMQNSKTIIIAGIEKINDQDAYKVVNGKKTYFYDVKTGMKVAQESTTMVNGSEMTQRVILSEYKAVNNILIPHKVSMNMMGMDVEQVVSSVKINEGITDADFK